MHAHQRIELLSGARVQATLVSPRLVIEEGAVFQGQCDMGSAAAGGKGAVVPMAPGLRSALLGRAVLSSRPRTAGAGLAVRPMSIQATI